MIPRAIDMIFSASAHLKDRGWKYQMEGQFLEVYNEVVSLRVEMMCTRGADTCRSMTCLGAVNSILRNTRLSMTKMVE